MKDQAKLIPDEPVAPDRMCREQVVRKDGPGGPKHLEPCPYRAAEGGTLCGIHQRAKDKALEAPEGQLSLFGEPGAEPGS